MTSILHEPSLGPAERPAPQTPSRVVTPIDDLLAKEAQLARQLELVRDAISRQLADMRKVRGFNEDRAAIVTGVRQRLIHTLERFNACPHMWRSDAAERLAQAYARIAVDRTPIARKLHPSSRPE